VFKAIELVPIPKLFVVLSQYKSASELRVDGESQKATLVAVPEPSTASSPIIKRYQTGLTSVPELK